MAEGREKLVSLLRSHSGDPEVTVYVKGFLGRGEKPGHFEAWSASHRALVESHGWGPRAYGFSWESGRFERLPLPAAAATKLAWDLYRSARRARRVALVGALGIATAEQIVRVSTRLASQYLAASRSARERAEHLAVRLARLAQRYDRVRVVAHSLGCRQVLEAAALLEAWQRPAEIHLCAPACRERDVAGKLEHPARRRTWLYYARNDLVLATAFRLMARGHALGAVGPRHEHPGLEALDVSAHLGLRAHGEYKHRFPEFAGGPRRLTASEAGA